MKKAVKLLSLCLLLLCLCLFDACTKTMNLSPIEKRKVGLIEKMNSGHYWGTIKQGAETAAREFNVSIYFDAPSDEGDIQSEIKMANNALDSEKVDALVLAASDYKALVKVVEKAYGLKIPVIIIDSEVDSDKINSYIATDNLEAGRKAGKILVDTLGGDKERNLAIMGFLKGSRNAVQREEGLLSVLYAHPNYKVVAKEYCSSDSQLAFNLTKKIISQNSSVNAIVALNSFASEGVAEAIDQMGLAGKVKIIGFDSTPKEIDYMEKGVIQAIIAQNPFSLGYLGVKYAVDAMNKKSIPKYTDTGSKIIIKESIYLPENQKLLFPFVK